MSIFVIREDLLWKVILERKRIEITENIDTIMPILNLIRIIRIRRTKLSDSSELLVRTTVIEVIM